MNPIRVGAPRELHDIHPASLFYLPTKQRYTLGAVLGCATDRTQVYVCTGGEGGRGRGAD